MRNDQHQDGGFDEIDARTLAGIICRAGEFLNGRQTPVENAERQAFAWLRQLRGIPNSKLEACLEVWEESGPRQALRAIDLREAWSQVQRSQPAQQVRTVYQGGEVTYTCWRCQDMGYCLVWQYGRIAEYQNGGEVKRGGRGEFWSRTMRPCGCDSTPGLQRLPLLTKDEWLRHAQLNEYARITQVIEHGAPSPQWEALAQQYHPTHQTSAYAVV